MDEHPALALREKKDASILVATDLVRRGEADAVVTAGHTGAAMAAAVLRLGRLPGVDRPALAVQMVTASGPFVLLDIGANPDSSGENLYQYAEMGALFAERVLGVERPRVALLSIGEERGKGDARIAVATQLLEQSDLQFVGNVEGKDLVKDLADVVVCDAVVGNVVIKFFEGLSTFIFDLIAEEFRRPPRGPIAYALMKPGVDRIRADLRLRALRRVAAPRGQGDGHHHPRPGAAADGRLRRRGRRGRGARPHPGAHRRDVPARADPARRLRRGGRGIGIPDRRGERQPNSGGRPRGRRSPDRDRPGRAERRPARRRRAHPAGRARGPRRRPGRPARPALAAPWAADRSSSRIDGRRVDARLSIVARPGHELVPLTRQVRSAVAAAIERLVGLEVGEIVVIVDGVGG